MTRNLFSVRSNPFEKKKIPFPENYSGSTLYDNYLLKILDENKDIKISKEIKNKKKEITTMFRNKFGRDFLNVKPDSLILFEKLFGQCLFEPDSQFLAHFPKLQKKLRNERKISELKLKEKINMGAMLFYDLRGKGKKKTQHLDMAGEKRFAVSKNFQSMPSKDVVQSRYFKEKNLENNQKFKNILEKNLIKSVKDLIGEEDEENLDKTISNIKAKDSSESKSGENESDSSLNNSNIKLFKEKNIGSYNFYMDKTSRKESNDNKLILNLNIKDDENTETKNKEAKNLRSKTTAKKGEKIITSYRNGNAIPILHLNNLKNKSRNMNNLFGILGNSNTFKNASYNISHTKINESNSNNSNFLNTMNNFNLSNSKGFPTKLNMYNKFISNKLLQKKKIISLKNKHYKFKDKLSNQITKLNQCTNKCNTELIKLIDINNDDNYAEKKKKYLNRNKLDIKGLLVEKKETKKLESESETDNEEKENQTEKLKEKEKDTIKNILEGALSDLKDKFGGKLVPQNKEQMLKRKINHISDEQALGMVDEFLEKQKELDVRKILGTDSKLQMKKKKEMILIRLKTKKNYDKMVRLKNQIIIDKGKIFRELDNIDIN